MSRIAFVSFLMIGVTMFSGWLAAGGEKKADAEKEIRDLEAAEAKAILAADLPALEKLWGDDFTVNAPDNQIRNRKSVAAAIKAGQIRYKAFERKVEYVGVHGDTAVVMGQESVTPVGGVDDGNIVDRRYTDVWRKKDGRWVMLARHAHIVSTR